MSLALRDIEYLLAVWRSGGMSAAAEACGVTQPALSKAVQRVEAEFGLQLFERSSRGMALTPAGQRVLEPMLRLHEDYGQAMQLANEIRAQRAGLLRVGVTDVTAHSRAAPALAALTMQRPGLRVQVAFGRSDALAARVRDGELDLALVPVYPGQPPEGEQTPIADDPMVAVVRVGHPLAGRPRIALDALAPFGWVVGSTTSAAYRALAGIYQRNRLAPPRVVVETPFASALGLELVAATDLITLVARSFMRHVSDTRFMVLPVAQLRVPRALVLLTRTGAALSPLVLALRDQLLSARRA